VAYAASIERLLEALHARAPAKIDALAVEKRRVAHGLLSVGLKLHCLGDEDLFSPLIDALGGKGRVLGRNVYKRSPAKFCLVLPPVGSARAAILLLECIEQYTGCRLFNNRSVQLQACSPGRLSRRHAALHAIGFYLSSDTLRQYALDDFATTVSEDHYHRGKRLVSSLEILEGVGHMTHHARPDLVVLAVDRITAQVEKGRPRASQVAAE
jgi:pimeloyl-ACP methyl ester carboxylesterase